MAHKILIVEDNTINMKLFRDLLINEGFDVEATEDGAIACDLARKSKPELILMDIQLKNISGLDIIKEMKADAELKDIPIIAVTAFAMQEDKDRIAEAGADGYISKPIYVVSFLEEVRKFLKMAA